MYVTETYPTPYHCTKCVFYCAEAEVDGAWREMPRLQVGAISEDDGLAERESRLRAVPFNKFLDRVPVPSLSIDRTEAVQNR